MSFAFLLSAGTVLVLVLVVGGVFLGSRRSGSGTAPPPPDVASGMLLNCPACGQETDAAGSVCRRCDAEL